MNVIEQNRDNYLARARSPKRVLLIIAGVIVFHLVVIAAAASWHGWMPAPAEGLIRLTIVADKPATAH